MIEVHKGVGGPEPRAQLFPRNHQPRMLKEHRQNQEGLLLQLDSNSFLPQFSGAEVHLKQAEAHGGRRKRRVFHRGLGVPVWRELTIASLQPQLLFLGLFPWHCPWGTWGATLPRRRDSVYL